MRKHFWLPCFLLGCACSLWALPPDSIRQECDRFREAFDNQVIHSPQSYIAQKNLQRVLHEVNALQVETRHQENLLMLYHVAGGVVVLFLAGLTTYHMRKRIKALRSSEQELARAVEQAKHSIQTKNIFLSNMSHEIRTPLNALSGFSSILTNSQVDSETREQCNEVIRQNSDLLLKLIDDVVDLSSIEKGILQFRYADVEVVAVCRRVVEMVEHIKQTAASVGFDTTLERLTLHTDEARLQQLLINLLINATKFTSEGTIRLTLTVEQGVALFAVADTGCGIAPEEREKVFNRFEKLDEQSQGAGLGLSIARLIVEKMGGRIWIDPDYTEGARFCVTHPLPSAPTDDAARKEGSV